MEILSAVDSEQSDPLSGFPNRTLTSRQFNSIAVSRTPQGTAAVVKIPEGAYDATPPFPPGGRVLLLEHVQDPGNVGTLVRTAGAFGYHGIILSSECADPFSPKAVQASAGAVLSVWIRRTDRYSALAKELQERGFKVIAAVLEGTPVTETSLLSDHVLLLGSEGSGLSRQLLDIADVKISIPVDRAKAESLNVAVAGGILMYCGMNKMMIEE
jgi:TrmH family RNA methyltransferase